MDTVTELASTAQQTVAARWPGHNSSDHIQQQQRAAQQQHAVKAKVRDASDNSGLNQPLLDMEQGHQQAAACLPAAASRQPSTGQAKAVPGKSAAAAGGQPHQSGGSSSGSTAQLSWWVSHLLCVAQFQQLCSAAANARAACSSREGE